MTGVEFLLAAVAVGAASAGVGAIASFQQAQAQASVASQNARLAIAIGERNAKAAMERSALQESMLRRDRVRRISSARAAYGAVGAQLEGTPLEVLANMAGVAEHEALLVRHAGVVEAEESRLQARLGARRSEIEGSFASSAGYGALIGGLGEAGATLLGGFDVIQQRGGLGGGQNEVPYYLQRP